MVTPLDSDSGVPMYFPPEASPLGHQAARIEIDRLIGRTWSVLRERDTMDETFGVDLGRKTSMKEGW